MIINFMSLFDFFHYSIIIAILMVAMFVYFRIADKFNIIDKPNERSSHDYITLRGGGIVWFLSGSLFSLFNLSESLYFLIGFTMVSVVSFWDDFASLSNKTRIIVHFLAISVLFYGLKVFNILTWWQVLIAYVFIVGILNAYNFMDGINGITGLYSLSVLIGLQYVNCVIVYFTQIDFINYAILACLVFLFFNFRKRAKCFAGDIGSMAVSFWIVTLLLQLILKTQSVIWILFLTVYGVDTILTILHRFYLKQNIFLAHRLHFYQVLTNERGFSHLTVASGYAAAQLIICFVIISLYRFSLSFIWITGIGMLFLCCLTYFLKFKKS